MGEDVRSVREHEHRGGVPDAWIDSTRASNEVDAAAVSDARALTTALMRRVDKVRIQRGLTIEQLAARSSLSTSLLHRMANVRPAPSLITLLNIPTVCIESGRGRGSRESARRAILAGKSRPHSRAVVAGRLSEAGNTGSSRSSCGKG